MASKKTSIFTLTERLTVSTANEVEATIDIGSYVDVGDRQALQIHSVDFIWQGTTAGGDVGLCVGTGEGAVIQVQDLNRGGLVFADDRALIASGALYCSTVQGMFQASDMYPDNFGKGSDDGRYVVNDQLYVVAKNTATPGSAYNVTVRINASIVTLTAKDFMAIAIQSTAADN